MLPDTITFELKQNHLGESTPGSSQQCMVAVALKEHLGEDYSFSVLSDNIIIYDDKSEKRYKYFTSNKLMDNIERYDEGKLCEVVVGEYTIRKEK